MSPKGLFKYCENIIYRLERLVEGGMVQHWKQEAVLAAAADLHNYDAKTRPSAISLKHLQVGTCKI